MSQILTRAAIVAALLCPVALPLAVQAADEKPALEHGSTLPTPGVVPTVPEVAPAKPAPPEIDEKANVLFATASASYKALTSFSELIVVTATVPNEKPSVRRTRVFYQRPSKALVLMSDDEGTSIIAADGKTLSMTVPQVKGKYMQRALPEPVNPVDVALQRTGSVGPGLDMWLSGEDLLAQVRPSISSLKMGVAEQLEGTDVESAVLTLKGRSGPVTLTFSFGKNDHLLRRLLMERTAQGPDGKEAKVTIAEAHTEVKPNDTIAPASLKFTPPMGYKKVESLEPPTYDEKLVVGGAPYAINAKDLSGKALNFAQYKGKVVLLDFWATWCGPCMMEMPNVEAAYKKYKAQGFEIVGISSDESKNDLQKVVKGRNLGWRMIFDGAEGPINAKYKVVAIPTSFLIGRDGKIAAINLRGPELEPAIKKALAQKTTAKTAVKPKTKR